MPQGRRLLAHGDVIADADAKTIRNPIRNGIDASDRLLAPVRAEHPSASFGTDAGFVQKHTFFTRDRLSATVDLN